MRGLVLPDLSEDFAADPVELFFDLAYVFAFSQLVALILDDSSWHGIGRASLLFLLLWMPWSQFTWSANAVSGNSRTVRVLFLVATAASVPMAASISSALDGGGLLFAVPLATIFLIALSMLVLGLETGSAAYRSTIRYAAPSVLAVLLIVIGALVDDGARVAVWIVALVVFGAGTIRAGGDEWVIRTGHFAERHGLIVIIALGEVIVALGNSVVVSDGDVAAVLVLTLLAAGVLASLLWWSYFDRVQPAFEHRAEGLDGVPLGRFVRDVYTYGHIPLVAGVILIAVALERMTLHPTDPLPFFYRMAGAAGIVMFFGGVAIGVFRSFRVVARERLVAVSVVVFVMAFGGRFDGVALFVAIDLIIFVALVTEHLRIERPHLVEAPATDSTA